MHRSSSALLAAVAAILCATAPLAAQKLASGEDPPRSGGLRLVLGEGPIRSAGAVTIAPFMGLDFPGGDLADTSNTGLTYGIQGTYGLGVLALMAEVSYSNFTGKLQNGIEFDDVSTFGFAAGARAAVPLAGLYAGGLAGYWTDADEFDLVPLVGIHVGPADVGVRYKGLLGDLDWFAITLAVHFRLR
jgi:hypothetical protein